MEHKKSHSKAKQSRVLRGRGGNNRRRSSRVTLESDRNLSEQALKNAKIALPEVYPWKVLDNLHKDLSEYLTESENKKLNVITRKRDMIGYKQLSEEWGLQSIVPSDMIPAVRAKYLLSSLLKKYQFPTSKAERLKVAKEKFFGAETLCKKQNSKSSVFSDLLDLDEAAFNYAKQFIIKVIGKTVPDMKVMSDKARHGPGATLCTRKGKTSSFFKYSQFPYSCTEQARDLAIDLISQDERWIDLLRSYDASNIGYTACVSKKNTEVPQSWGVLIDGRTDWNTMEDFWSQFIKIVPGNRITFVAKNAFTERTIAIEPTLNLMLQLGVDGFIRKQLKRFGVNLDDQEKNQELARIGSIDGSFATLDLKAASDTISLWVCWMLLPHDWFVYLMKLRSPEGELDGDTIYYEKMSSMGNGFTFALESLIFASLTYAASKMNLGPISPDFSQSAVYGDDIIVKTEHVSTLVPLLYKAGFRLNTEKSFVSGKCRESCGTDWFNGYNVRPVFMQALPKDVKELWADINRLQRTLELRFAIPFGSGRAVSLMRKWIPHTFSEVIGPRSNEDFDTYLHEDAPYSAVASNYSKELFNYEFIRIVKSPIALQLIGAYRFRKLMHDLRPFVPDKYSWQGDKTGRRFDVISRNAMTLSKIKASTNDWYSPYVEITPAPLNRGGKVSR